MWINVVSSINSNISYDITSYRCFENNKSLSFQFINTFFNIWVFTGLNWEHDKHIADFVLFIKFVDSNKNIGCVFDFLGKRLK